MPSLIVACYAVFGGCLWEACSFLRGDDKGDGSEEKREVGERRDLEGGETAVRM